MYSKLKIPQISIYMHLGLMPEEQKEKQEVLISAEFLFNKEPSACDSDQIEGTINYAEVAESIEKQCLKKTYKLIEHLAKEIWLQLKKEYSAKILIQVHKPKPPHRLLDNGSDFYYGDSF